MAATTPEPAEQLPPSADAALSLTEIEPRPAADDDFEFDSLPSSPLSSSSSSHTITSSDVSRPRHRHPSDAEQEWRESIQQLELILSLMVVPFLGKYFGRKAAYWGWAKFMTWRYPVDVVLTSSAAFKATGALEAASNL